MINIFDDYKRIENKTFDYRQNFLLDKDIKIILDESIQLKRDRKYMEALRLYYKHMVPRHPNHPTILYSMAKIVLTIGHFQLASNLLKRVIGIEANLGIDEYRGDAEYYISLILSAKKDTDRISLQARVSGQDNFIPLGYDDRKTYGINNDFNSEYEYLNFLFNKKLANSNDDTISIWGLLFWIVLIGYIISILSKMF